MEKGPRACDELDVLRSSDNIVPFETFRLFRLKLFLQSLVIDNDNIDKLKDDILKFLQLPLFNGLGMDEIESLLRKLNSSVYLVALPTIAFSPDMVYGRPYQFVKDGLVKQYGVKVCLRGDVDSWIEMYFFSSKLSISQLNLQNLKECGFYTPCAVS